MSEKKVPALYRFIRGSIRFIYRKYTVSGTENLPEGPVILVGNHTQIHGPIACELYFPERRWTWCAAQMMRVREVPAYAYKDFWSQKPRALRPLFRLVSFLIAPLAAYILSNANTIPVYRDARLTETFRTTLQRLGAGDAVVIFPERDAPYNHILSAFQDRFVDLGKFYYRESGRALAFVPMYIAPELRTITLGTPVRYDPAAPLKAERDRICAWLMREITDLACAMPEHTVVPYRNIPKRDYPTSRPKTRDAS